MKLCTYLKTIKNSISFQLFASFWISVAAILGIAFALPQFDARTYSDLEANKRSFFSQESQLTQSQNNLDEVFSQSKKRLSPNGFEIILLDSQTGQFRGATENNIRPLQAFAYRANSPEQPLQRRFGNIEIHGPFLVQSNSRQYFQYFIEQVSPQTWLLSNMFDSAWLMLAILLVISTPFLMWRAKRLARPVKALHLTANAVAMGNLSINPKLETEGIYELRQVGKSFNKMITSLQNLTSHQQRLLADISHELKTPLTRMQLAIGLIRRRNGESAELARLENEVQKLNTMILDLLALSRQQMNQHLTKQIFPIHKMWEDIFDDAKFEAEQQNLDLFVSQRISFPERYFINGNQQILASALENVIRNAEKYANTMIKITTYIDKNELVFLIDDNGQGVPESEYEQIFRPFYRVDEARARQTGGTGLGLAIVANAVKQHKGTILAEKSPLGGLRIQMRLPLWLE